MSYHNPPGSVAVLRKHERTPAQVVLDIKAANKLWRSQWSEDGECAELDRCDVLKAELCRMVEGALGVSCADLLDALS